MSRIAGSVHFDGRRASVALLRALLNERQGDPHGGYAVADGPVGLACNRDDSDRLANSQSVPWVVADARIDGREDLERALGPSGTGAAGDHNLIRRAFIRWGASCVDHLLGDFAFAVWTGDRLWLARDHMGVKPLYTMRLRHGLVFASDISCLQAHPEFDGRLDEIAIADFLFDGFPRDLTSTAFSQIRRLPPAHIVEVDPRVDAKEPRRYWSLPHARPRFWGRNEALDHFHSLLRRCVADRLPAAGRSLGIMMSGGLDSTSVAVTASQLLRGARGDDELRACTMIGPGDPEDEAHHAGLVASAAGIVHDVYEVGTPDSWKRDAFPWVPPEPGDLAFQLPRVLLRDGRAPYRVALTGQGGDPALATATSDVLLLLRRGRILKLGSDAVRHRLAFGSWPRAHLRVALGHARHRDGLQARTLPTWVNRDWVASLPWPERWAPRAAPIEPMYQRAEAHADLTSTFWPHALEAYASLGSRHDVEVRHPYLDVRMLGFLTSLPGSPWCEDKFLIREAFRSVLPEAVRARPKTLVQGFAAYDRLIERGPEWLADLPQSPALGSFVDVERLAQLAGQLARLRPEEEFLVTRPLSLAIWLDRLRERLESRSGEKV